MTSALVLGIDTSGTEGSVAILDPSGTSSPRLVEEAFTEGLIHGVALAPAVAGLLDRMGTSAAELALVAVGTGPGSYTGVRVGVAFAKTLSFSTGVPLAGVPSLDAMARAAAHDGPIACVRDARRGHLYLSLYRPGPDGPTPDGPVILVRIEDASSAIPAGALILGDAIARYGEFLSGEGRILGDAARWRSPAGAVAECGQRALVAGRTTAPHDLTPVYLRPSEAEERWDRRKRTV